MTNTEKKVVMQLCTKILTETELYEIDMEVRNLVDWICVSEQMKVNNSKIRSLIGKYKQIELECREGIRKKLECIKSVRSVMVCMKNRMSKGAEGEVGEEFGDIIAVKRE